MFDDDVEVIELLGRLRWQTDKAYLIEIETKTDWNIQRTDEWNRVERWVPKSQCEKRQWEQNVNFYIFTMPLYLASEKGFV